MARQAQYSVRPWFSQSKCSIFLRLGKTNVRTISGEIVHFHHFLTSLADLYLAVVVPRSWRFRFILSLVRVRCWCCEFFAWRWFRAHNFRVRNVGSRLAFGSPKTSIFKIAPPSPRRWGLKNTLCGQNRIHTAHTGFTNVSPVWEVLKKIATDSKSILTNRKKRRVSGAPRRRRRRNISDNNDTKWELRLKMNY